MKLTNQKLLEVQQALAALNKIKLPIKTSLDIAFLANTIDNHVKVFAQVRDKLMHDYQITVEPVGDGNTFRFHCKDKEHETENLEKFMPEFNELVAMETGDLKVKKIILPETVSTVCEHCHQKMNIPLQIESEILKPLTEFIEVA